MCTFMGSVIDESDKSWDIEGKKISQSSLI